MVFRAKRENFVKPVLSSASWDSLPVTLSPNVSNSCHKQRWSISAVWWRPNYFVFRIMPNWLLWEQISVCLNKQSITTMSLWERWASKMVSIVTASILMPASFQKRILKIYISNTTDVSTSSKNYVRLCNVPPKEADWYVVKGIQPFRWRLLNRTTPKWRICNRVSLHW